MGSGHDGAHAGFAFLHCRISNTRAQDSFLEQFAGKLHRQLSVADDDRGDGRFAGGGGFSSDIETKQPKFFLPETGIVPELFDSLRLLLEYFEGGNASRRHGGWMRSGKQKRPRPVVEKINQIARSADITAQSPNRL